MEIASNFVVTSSDFEANVAHFRGDFRGKRFLLLARVVERTELP